ncbi:MAG: DUF3105 domain-containing protein, partial [Mycobacteriales bacterium]
GAVWVTYNPDKVKGTELATLKKDVGSDPYHMMSPYPGLKSPISLQAWGQQIFVDKITDGRIKKFLELFTQGPQTPEKGASCVNYTGDKQAADAAFNGHASASGKPAGAASPGTSATTTPAPAATATVTPKPTPTKK